jgi:hypothetical protein
MSVCFNGHGTILVKKERIEVFSNEFNEKFKEFDKFGKTMFNEYGLFQFKNYVRHYFIDEFKKFIEENVKYIEEGRVWFKCDEEDGSVKNPFPFIILIEIVDGKIYEETLYTRIGEDWDMYVVDHDWFFNVSNEIEKEVEDIYDSVYDKNKENEEQNLSDDSDLPF